MKSALKSIVYDPAALGLASHTAQTRFGKMHYVAPKKPSSKEVMLFIHGFGSSWTVWTPLIQAAKQHNLLKNTDFLLVDLPSFGKSENNLSHLNSAEIGEELLKLCEKLGYSKVRVTGHSMGGFLTLDMAARHPHLLSVHIVAGTYFRLVRVANNPLKGMALSPRLTFYYLFQTMVSRSRFLTKAVNKLYKFLLGPKHKALYEVGGRSFLYASRNGLGFDATKNWGSIKIPVHGAYGGIDRLVSNEDMQEFQKILPKAKLSVIEGAGHSLLITHPNQVALALY